MSSSWSPVSPREGATQASSAWGAAAPLAALGATFWSYAAVDHRLTRPSGWGIAAWAVVVPVAIAVADLLSGIVHWVCDTFGDEDAAVVGPAVIAPFRDHHRDPMTITRHGPFERNANNAFAALPVSLAGLLPGAPAIVTWGALVCSVAVLCTNQAHAWAHAPRAPRVVRWLQRRRVLLPPDVHAQHHLSGASHYSVTTGWTCGALDLALALARAPRRSR